MRLLKYIKLDSLTIFISYESIFFSNLNIICAQVFDEDGEKAFWSSKDVEHSQRLNFRPEGYWLHIRKIFPLELQYVG